MEKFVVGVDVGGTNIKLGLVGAQGQIKAKSRLKTAGLKQSKSIFVDALVNACLGLMSEQNISKRDILGVGMGLPGIIDPYLGVVHILPNIPGWRNVPLKSVLESKLKIPVFMDNDVNLIALAEWKFGAGRGIKNQICMTLGTGVGGGLILDGKLYRGEGFAAGELGHIPLHRNGPVCGCGAYGCLECYVGNTRLIAKAKEIFNDPDITLEKIFAKANANNSKALKFWKDAGEDIGFGLVGVINVLNPKLIVIGGGVSNNHKYLFPAIRRVIKERCMSKQASMIKIVRGQLGDQAGILGADVLVRGV